MRATYCSRQMQPPPTRIPAGIRNALGAALAGPARRSRPQSRRLAVFALGQIGDFVLALSAIRLLLAREPAGTCVLIVAPPVAELARRELPGLELLILPADAPSFVRDILPCWWRDRRGLGAYRFERLVCFSHQRSLFFELALSWLVATEDFRLQPDTYPPAADGLGTELPAHHRLVEIVLGRPVARAEIMPRLTSAATGNDGRLLVFPLARDPRRCLAVETTATILGRAKLSAAVVFGGAPFESARLEAYAVWARAAGVDRVSVETPAGLSSLINQVAAAGAVLAADSGPAHLAGALDKPCVTLTTPAYFGYCQPWANSERQRLFLHEASAETVAEALRRSWPKA